MEHYQGPKARFIRTCEGYVRSKALDVEDNDYDNEWHKGLDNEASSPLKVWRMRGISKPRSSAS